jgi:hypothetical protein
MIQLLPKGKKTVISVMILFVVICTSESGCILHTAYITSPTMNNL